LPAAGREAQRVSGSGQCGNASSSAAAKGHTSHQEYARWRARQIAYRRWDPWADAEPVRAHVLRLRLGGASYRAIACAAGLSPMTVHNLVNGCQSRNQPPPWRIGSAQARRILAVTPEAAGAERRGACGTRRRLQALVALGHSPANLGGELGISQPRMRRLLRGQAHTVSSATHGKVCQLYSRIWNQLPAERTARERTVADAARHLARTANWPPPMALDDDRIDDPAYRTRAAWRQASGLPRPPAPDHT